MTSGSKKRQRLLEKMSPLQLESVNFKSLVALCCKEMDIDKVMQEYRRVKEIDVHISEDTYNSMVCLVAGLGEQGSGSFPPRTTDPPFNFEAAFDIYQDAIANNVKLGEASYTALIRCSCITGRCSLALQLYEELKMNSIIPRLRTITPLLQALSKALAYEACFTVFDEAINIFQLNLGEREYAAVLRLCAALGDTRFFSVLDMLKENILIPSSETWKACLDWFASPVNVSYYNISENEVTETGYILPHGPQLNKIELSAENREELLEQIERAVLAKEESRNVNNNNTNATDNVAASAGSNKKTKSILTDWTNFKNWLTNDSMHPQQVIPLDSATNNDVPSVPNGPPAYDIILDGANIGYYQQNYAGAPGHIDYLQVDAVIRHLQRLGKKVLLILHCRHLIKDVIPKHCKEVVNSWKKAKLLYTTPGGCNDDLFWLYAAVFLNCNLVTNDEMRDHHFRMLSPRWFERWKERHQIHFSFGKNAPIGSTFISNDVGGDTSLDTREDEFQSTAPVPQEVSKRRIVHLTFPMPYSQQIQILRDEHDNIEYYIPSSETSKWLCISSLLHEYNL